MWLLSIAAILNHEFPEYRKSSWIDELSTRGLDAVGVGGNITGSRGFASVQNGLGFKVAGDPRGWDVAYRNPARLININAFSFTSVDKR